MAEISAPSVIGPATLDDLLNDQYERVARSSALAAANFTRVLSQSFGIPLNWVMHSEYDPRQRLLSGPLPGQLKRAPAGTCRLMLPGDVSDLQFLVFYNVWFGSGGTASERNVRICGRSSAPGTVARAGDGLRGARRRLIGQPCRCRSPAGSARRPQAWAKDVTRSPSPVRPCTDPSV